MDLTDAQRRAMNHDRSFCVTAGAGAGKTRVLVEKYISLLENGVQVSEILALTFTEKAAAEMKERVRSAIRNKQGDQWRQVEEDFHWATISTFHSFCARVLSEHPFEAGILPSFKVLEDMEKGQLLNEALDHMVSQPPESLAEPLTSLLIDVPLTTFQKLMTSMYSNRFELDRIFSTVGSIENLEDLWKACLQYAREETVTQLEMDGILNNALRGLVEIGSRLPDKEDAGTRYVLDIMPHISVFLEDKDLSNRYESLIAISIKTNRVQVGSKKNWDERDKQVLNECRRVIADVLEQASIKDLEEDGENFVKFSIHYLEDLFTCFQVFKSSVDQAKRLINALDFDDMIFLIWELFNRDPKARMDYSRTFRYILVDEFQDTDRIQWGIVRMILGELGKSDRLFIVGDPKQSIYLFRGIDVSMFKEAQEEVIDVLGGEPVYLDVCFRSTPEIVNLANYVFERLMPSSSKPFEFEYGRMNHSEYRANDRGSIELIMVDKGDQTARTESELIAGRIRDIVDKGEKMVYWDGDNHLADPRPVKFGDITILLRARTNLRFIEWALNRAGIPYHIHAGLGFFESQEVRDIYNILSFLANERNDLALYGLLRSPYFAFSDEDLYRVSNAGRGSLWHSLMKYSEVSGDAKFKDARGLIDSWLKIANRFSISEILARIFPESGIYSVYAGMVEGEQAIANMEKLLGIARNAQEQGFGSLSRFMEWFERAIEEAPREGLATLDLDTGDCVNIMTIHAAKGLEFPVVFVPEMSRDITDFGDPILIDREFGLGLNIPDPDDSHRIKETCIRRIIKRRNRERERAEYRRLLYVAMTRAKDHLIMSGREPHEYPDNLMDDGSWMELLLASIGLTEEEVLSGEKSIELEGLIVPLTILQAKDILDIGIHVKHEPLVTDERLIEAISSSTMENRPLRPQKDRIFTPSMIELYMRCPRRYWERYEIGLPESDIEQSAIEETPARKGQIIHEILRGRDPALVLRRYGIINSELVKKYTEMRERFLSSDLMMASLEEYCELPIRFSHGKHTFMGTIDRLIRTDEGWYIIDFKTGEVEVSEVKEISKEYAIQMVIYAQGVSHLLGINPRVMIYFPSCEGFQESVVDEDTWEIVVSFPEMIFQKKFEFKECAECRRVFSKGILHGICPVLRS